jgi:hypothetical protein
MMRQNRLTTALLALAACCALAVAACERDFTDRILAFDGEGAVRVFVFRDDNLNGAFNAQTDPVVVGAPVTLRRTSTNAGSVTFATDSGGFYKFEKVGVGRYFADLSPVILGDSLERIGGNPEFTVVEADTIRISIALQFPSVSISEARTSPVGRKVWVRGTVLNSANLFGDSTVHMTDGVASIRMARVRATGLANGDTVQMLGTRSVRDGQPIFNVVAVLERGFEDPPPLPTHVSSAVAATADGGELDAALVKVSRVVISDTLPTLAGRVLTTSDGSGPLRVLLSSTINFGAANQYLPGLALDVTGVLVPDATQPGRWILKPRARPEVVIVP